MQTQRTHPQQGHTAPTKHTRRTNKAHATHARRKHNKHEMNTPKKPRLGKNDLNYLYIKCTHNERTTHAPRTLCLGFVRRANADEQCREQPSARHSGTFFGEQIRGNWSQPRKKGSEIDAHRGDVKRKLNETRNKRTSEQRSYMASSPALPPALFFSRMLVLSSICTSV